MNRYFFYFFVFLLVNACIPVIGVSTIGMIKTGVEVADDPRTVGRIVDDEVIEKKFLYKITQIDEKYLLKISTKSIDGRFILKGNVDTIDEKIKMTKIAWETNGVRSVENIIKVNDQSSLTDKAKDLLITSQFKVALIAHKEVKSNNFSFTTINKNLYIFGIARTEEERKIVINEAKAGEYVYDHPFLWGSKRTGPDLHRVGGKYSDNWHFNHMYDPQSTSSGSIMPRYPWLIKNELDKSQIEAKMKTMVTLGVAYSEDDIANAQINMLEQGSTIEENLYTDPDFVKAYEADKKYAQESTSYGCYKVGG